MFHPGTAFDVNPVVWRELLDGGVPIRGPAPAGWGLDPEPDRLAAWNLANLRGYWTTVERRQARRRRPFPARSLEWCVLGPPRLHATIADGRVLSKEAAGRYALARFPQHRPIIEAALARLHGLPLPQDPPRSRWRRLVVAFMRTVREDAEQLMAAPRDDLR